MPSDLEDKPNAPEPDVQASDAPAASPRPVPLGEKMSDAAGTKRGRSSAPPQALAAPDDLATDDDDELPLPRRAPVRPAESEKGNPVSRRLPAGAAEADDQSDEEDEDDVHAEESELPPQKRGASGRDEARKPNRPAKGRDAARAGVGERRSGAAGPARGRSGTRSGRRVRRPAPKRSPRYYVGLAVVGLLLVGVHGGLFQGFSKPDAGWDWPPPTNGNTFPLQVVALAGIILCIYAFVKLGSLNEIDPDDDPWVPPSQKPRRPARAE